MVGLWTFLAPASVWVQIPALALVMGFLDRIRPALPVGLSVEPPVGPVGGLRGRARSAGARSAVSLSGPLRDRPGFATAWRAASERKLVLGEQPVTRIALFHLFVEMTYTCSRQVVGPSEPTCSAPCCARSARSISANR